MDDKKEKLTGVVAYLTYVRILRVESAEVRRQIARLSKVLKGITEMYNEKSLSFPADAHLLYVTSSHLRDKKRQ